MGLGWKGAGREQLRSVPRVFGELRAPASLYVSVQQARDVSQQRPARGLAGAAFLNL